MDTSQKAANKKSKAPVHKKQGRAKHGGSLAKSAVDKATCAKSVNAAQTPNDEEAKGVTLCRMPRCTEQKMKRPRGQNSAYYDYCKKHKFVCLFPPCKKPAEYYSAWCLDHQ